MWIQTDLLSGHLTSLRFADVAFFTDWRQDPLPAKRITTRFIAGVWSQTHEISKARLQKTQAFAFLYLFWHKEATVTGMPVTGCRDGVRIWRLRCRGKGARLSENSEPSFMRLLILSPIPKRGLGWAYSNTSYQQHKQKCEVRTKEKKRSAVC